MKNEYFGIIKMLNPVAFDEFNSSKMAGHFMFTDFKFDLNKHSMHQVIETQFERC